MSELTDDQLDELFRKSAEEFEPTHDPGAWPKMSALLDSTDQTRPAGALLWKNLLRWGLPVVLLLLLTGGGWFVYQKVTSGERNALSSTVVSQQPEGNTTAKGSHQIETSRLADTEQPTEPQKQAVEQPASDVQPSTNRAESTDGRTPEANSTSQVKLTDEQKILPKAADNVAVTPANSPASSASDFRTATKPVTSTYKSVKSANVVKSSLRNVAPLAGRKAKGRVNRSSQTNVSTIGSFTQQRSVFTNRRRIYARRDGNVMTPSVSFDNQPDAARKSNAGMPPADEPRSATLAESVEAEPEAVALMNINELASKSARWPKNLSFVGRPVEAHPDTTVRKVIPNVTVQRGLSVRFVVAPDLSSIGLKNFTRPGTNVGLLLEYRFASRWSVQAGVIQSTKVYKALPGEYDYYNLPSEIKRYPANFAGVDGRCNMLDIPINLRYDVLVKPRDNGRQPTRWFISSGLTSYIMNKEDYSYKYYHSYAGNPTDTTARSGGYGLSNLNFSIGYERSISKRLSWQVEPFIKVPIKKVGYYKIDLLSTGAFFSIRYKL
ncbi:hypothetical protein IC229_24220 [Spirosoma sp. BT702]|uniref:Outer membrane protein beta-barrel domain-containing protein n=1 Tax=Spirosoma profusum TaxID=2771354 RepID=A0A926XZC7_9BACT|nr:hypothetical protein [Spirosoma profusum]MBD2703774.1 hypothetical protein [Spirosoma profusum]